MSPVPAAFLPHTVNENFFIGNQWEGVEAKGLPAPTFNMFKRILNFQVSNITSDKPVIRALAMPSTSSIPMRNLEKIAEIVSQQFSFISQRNRLPGMLREFLRNAGVTGDGCIHCYFDPTIENGQDVKGEIVCEVIDNLRVMFGNPNCRDVQKQPYIIISRRELVEDVRWRAENMKEAGLCNIDDVDSIKPDSEKFQNKYDAYTDDKVTVLTYYFRNRETKTIWCMESTESGLIREAYDTEYTLYPLVWLNWDYIRDCYHGQAKGIRQCLLVMGESSEDGVLVDSSGYGYARYAAHVPAARLILQNEQMAEFPREQRTLAEAPRVNGQCSTMTMGGM